MRFLATFIGLSTLALPAIAQFEGAAATRDQQAELQPLVRSVSLRLEQHIPSVIASDVTVRVRKALFNQNSDVASKRYEELLIELLLDDLDLSKDSSNPVRYEMLPRFGKQISATGEALIGGEEKRWSARDKQGLLLSGVAIHARCIRRDSEARWAIRTWNGRDLEKDQERGLKELAKYYGPLFVEVFEVEKPDRKFSKMLEAALLTSDTDRAVLTTLTKVHFLIRPTMLAELEVGEELEDKLEARAAIEDRVREVLSETDWWPALREDHKAMLDDPKAFRRELKARDR